MPKVTIRPNGPYLLTGPFDLVDAKGTKHAIPDGKIVALCRCGQARNKPLCDGSHNGCGFKDDNALPPVT
jgi:CDGSH-type Zn-finger protein